MAVFEQSAIPLAYALFAKHDRENRADHFVAETVWEGRSIDSVLSLWWRVIVALRVDRCRLASVKVDIDDKWWLRHWHGYYIVCVYFFKKSREGSTAASAVVSSSHLQVF